MHGNDTDRRFNRHLIRMAFEMAVARINKDATLGVNVYIDSDTEGVPGWAPITQTILDKIDHCDIFAPDVTFVCKTEAGKLIPNPNVMFKSGYAFRALTYKAMMPVMNTAYGQSERLPFDMGHLRHPITYYVEATAGNQERRAVRARLVDDIEKTLRLQIAATQPPPPAPLPFPTAEAKGGPARFRQVGEPIGRRWDSDIFSASRDQEIFLEEGPAIWLRLMPAIDPGRKWPAHELKDQAIRTGSLNLEPFYYYNISLLRAEDGIAVCPLETPDAVKTTSAAFAFETGEVWSVDTAYLAHEPGKIPYIEAHFIERLFKYSQFLSGLGVNPPYHWIGGITGVKDCRLIIPAQAGAMAIVGLPGPLCAADTITAEGDYDARQTPASALHALFKSIFDKCGTRRPDYLPR